MKASLRLVAAIFALSGLLVFGCAQPNPPADTGSADLSAGLAPYVGRPVEECQLVCNDFLSPKDSGPCLANPLAANPDFVCDLVHVPRAPVDDLPENQCPAFAAGRASHFVEVDSSCALVRQN